MSEADFIAFPPPSEAGSSRPSKAKSNLKEKVNTTLFVSSLPYTATTTDLLTHFSFLGPVRHGFIATDKPSGKSKGVGYVTYSLREDAEKAVEELNRSDFGEKGRKIRVTWADQKPDMKERKTRDAALALSGPKPPKTRPEAPSASVTGDSTDPDAIRTLILTGLPNDITKNVLWKRIRKVNDSITLSFPIEGEEGTAHLLFKNHGDAIGGIPKLHGHTYKGSLLSAVLKKRMDKLTKNTVGGKASHAGKLIVRNLPWDASESDLRATFLPHGPLHSITIPTAPSILPGGRPRAKGFAFVWFMSRKDAEKAMENVNGRPIIRGVGHKPKQNDKEERLVAVDWALSKDKWEEANHEEDSGGAVKASGDSDESGSEESSDSDSDEDEDDEDEDGDSSDESASSGDESEGSGSNDEDDDEEVEEEDPVKPKLPTVDVGSTLFIRNLPFETEEQELNTLFRSFGPLRYARITMDKETGRSRGTGFVCFWKTEDADKAIGEAERVHTETGSNAMPLGERKNPFALPSVLTVDPSASVASRLVIHGRTLDVTRAVTREQAGQMKEDSEKARNANDKRNTYLMREGVIFPNSPAASTLPAAEIEKRQASFNARRTLLRSNPALYISKTRLSIRQLPLFATDRTLKRLALHAVRMFDDEVKCGDREDLERSENMDPTISPALEGKDSKGMKKRGERQTAVVQSKVVRSSEKSDPLTGNGRSKGYGFLEIRSHKEALKVLRWANNNPDVGGLMWSWWKLEMGEILERTKNALEEARRLPASGSNKSESAGEGGKGKEKEKESVEELEGRVRRLEARLAEGDDKSQGGMRGGKTLLIEFSIENVQVVRRRVEKISATRTNGPPSGESRGREKRKSRDDDEDGDDHSSNKRNKSDRGRSGKKGSKARGTKESDNPAEEAPVKQNGDVPEKKGLEKLGSQLGALIGRKRKMRKGGK